MIFGCFGTKKEPTSKTASSNTRKMPVATSATTTKAGAAATKNAETVSQISSSPSNTTTAANASGKEEHEEKPQDPRIVKLQEEIEPIRKKIVDHTVYAKVNSVERLSTFMQSHIYAVWDFMSLLKHLQRELTCIDHPWVPVGDPRTRYLINEIVTDEECDVSEEGVRMSHFELYLLSMEKAGAPTEQIEEFVRNMVSARNAAKANGLPVQNASQVVAQSLSDVGAKQHVKDFVQSTFDVINSGKLHVAAACFTFGREDLIPHMFITFVRELHQENPEKFQIFKYYLERHIEVDGDHHAILAHEMTALLCGDDEQKWAEATEAVKFALQARVDLWDAIEQEYDEESN